MPDEVFRCTMPSSPTRLTKVVPEAEVSDIAILVRYGNAVYYREQAIGRLSSV